MALLSPYVRRAGIAIAVSAALMVAAAAPIARFLIVRSEPLQGDAIVVLAGSSVYDERVDHAIRLFKQGRARTIILTNDGVRGGWSRRHQRNVRPIERATDAISDAGIVSNQLILLTQRVRSTYDEAQAVLDAARARRMTGVIIVTSPYHSRRALWTFTRLLAPEGIRVTVDPAPLGGLSPAPRTWWMKKSGWYNVALEYPKLAYYMLRRG